MDAVRTLAYENARTFERDLNPRQREVLALIAAGKTNAEIAEALDLTFYGAKWNVSEILSKLGLSSRDEAADYWRWRQSVRTKVRAALRALVPGTLPARLLAGSGALAIVVVAIVFVLMLGESDDHPTIPPGTPFRLTATIRESSSGRLVSQHDIGLQWSAPGHYRMQFTNTDLTGVRHSGTHVGDGVHTWIETPNGIFRTIWIDRGWSSALAPWDVLGMLGPAAGESLLGFLAHLETLQPPASDRPNMAQAVGTESVAGRTTTVIEYAPVVVLETTNAETGARVRTGYGEGKVWLDESAMFVLRHEVTGQPIPEWGPGVASIPANPITDFVAEITSVEFDPQFAPGSFEFVPPPGTSVSDFID